MSYFKSFSRINYSFDDGDTIKTCVDIVTRVGLKDKIKNFTEMFMDYDVEDGERPEVLADRIYGDPELHWIILISNEIHNQYYDWPMSQRQLNNHADRKHPGSSFFLTGVSGATWFPKETSYLKNDVIRGISGGTFGMTQGSVTSLIADDRAGLVHDWDKTYARLVVTSVSGDFASGDLITTLKSDADGSTIYNISRIGRAVDISHDAVHHFEGPSGDFLSPFGTAPDANGKQYLLGRTGAGGATINYEDTVLQNYISDSTDTYTITNYAQEFKDNEKKRSIKIIRPRYVTRIAQELRDVIQGNV